MLSGNGRVLPDRVLDPGLDLRLKDHGPRLAVGALAVRVDLDNALVSRPLSVIESSPYARSHW
jgi:hypothetical protein